MDTMVITRIPIVQVDGETGVFLNRLIGRYKDIQVDKAFIDGIKKI